jgi:hypothetical protein
MIAKKKNTESLVGTTPAGLFLCPKEANTNAKKTQTTVFLSRLPKPDRLSLL